MLHQSDASRERESQASRVPAAENSEGEVAANRKGARVGTRAPQEQHNWRRHVRNTTGRQQLLTTLVSRRRRSRRNGEGEQEERGGGERGSRCVCVCVRGRPQEKGWVGGRGGGERRLKHGEGKDWKKDKRKVRRLLFQGGSDVEIVQMSLQ